MPTGNITQTNFSSGELGKKTRGRFDIDIYRNGCRRMQNWIAEVQGSARFRTGTEYVHPTKDNQIARFVTFNFNDEQAYILEFTDLNMRVFKDGGIVLEDEHAATINDISAANPSVFTTTAAHGFATGTKVLIEDVVGGTAEDFNDNEYTITVLSATTFHVGIQKTGYTSGGTATHKHYITGISSADPSVFTSAGHGLSTGDEVYLTTIVDTGTGEAEGLNGRFFKVVVIDADTFSVTDLWGEDIQVTDYSSGGYFDIVYELTTTIPEADLFEFEFAQNADTMYIVHRNRAPVKLTRTGHAAWTMATFVRTVDPFGAGPPLDWPGSVAFYEGRLVYGGTNAQPEHLFFSRGPQDDGTTRYDDFTTGTDADHAVIYPIAPVNGKVDTIRWLVGNNDFLIAGTFGGLTKITGSTPGEPIAPSSISTKPVDAYGVEKAHPVPNGNIIMYIQRGGLVIRSLEFDLMSDDYVSVDRNLASDDIVGTGITQVEFQFSRPDLMWAVRSDGILGALTFKSREDVSGWHRHPIGGTSSEGSWGKVLTAAIYPQTNNVDQVWVVVERTIDGDTRRYIEYFSDLVKFKEAVDFYTGQDNEAADYARYLNVMYENQKQYSFVDSAVSFDGSDRGTAAAATLTPAAGAVTVGSTVTFTASQAVFASTDLNHELWKKHITGDESGRAKITTVTDSTHVECKILVAFDDVDAMAAGDWYLTVNGLSGIEHLEGETVTVLTDGRPHPDLTVSSGGISLNYEASVIRLGEGYSGVLETQSISFGEQSGPTQTQLRNINQVGIRFLESLGVKVGTSLYNCEPIINWKNSNITSRPNPLTSGVHMQKIPGAYDRDTSVFILQELPLPATIQMLDYYGDVGSE